MKRSVWRLQARIAAIALSLLAVATIGAAETLRVMPLGDSITEGTRSEPGYRPVLWQLLENSGYQVDFVGSMSGHYGDRAAGDFDPDHEGHWGWRADEVLERIDGWAAASRPDIVLLHLGSNDVGTGESPAQTAGEIARIIEILRDRNPSVTVLLAQIIPIAHPLAAMRIRRFNDALEDLADDLDRPESPVRVVDHYAGFDADDDTYDGIHPNANGAGKMAHKWYDAIVTVTAGKH